MSDDVPSNAYGSVESNEKGNKGMSLMVIAKYYEAFNNIIKYN